MVFSSFHFLFFFLPALLLCYFLIPQKLRAGRNLLLLAFSLFFYAYGGVRFLPLMLVSIGINYLFGLLCAPGLRGRRLFLWLGTACNLALLGWFKYAGFAARNLRLLGAELAIPEVVLPIGISFFTFQGMSYVFDVYRGEAAPEKNPLWVALYVSLFPQLVAGPIVRYTTVAGELRLRQETLDGFTEGAVRFLFGLSKKLILANGVGALADAVYGSTLSGLTVSLAWLGSVAYTLQIYFDFSAYSDMAIGLGRIFGFHFLENFDYPYISRSITEFWRRWHISLSTWFRDYVYIPLGGNRRGPWRQLLNLLIVWSLTGLWHGAEWTFVLWGLYYFLLLAGERFLWGKAVARLGPLRHLYALFFINAGWVLFRAESVSKAGGVLRAMLGGAPLSDGRTTYYLLEYGWVLALAVVAALPWKRWLEQWLQARQQRPLPRILLLWWPRLAALGLLVLSYMQLLTSTFNPFIYFRF